MKIVWPQKKEGSALLLALCAIALMSVTVLGLVGFTDLGLKEQAGKEKDFRAMQLSLSGIALGLHPEIERDDPVLEQKLNSTESFSVRFKSEGGKLNLNTVLLAKQEDVLDRLFEQWGVKLRDRTVLVDSLMDWVDTDSVKRLDGFEQKDYQAKGLKGYAPNRPFQNLNEVDLVRGIEALAKLKPDWKDYFTVWSDGLLDLNDASPDVIQAVCEVPSSAAESFSQGRLGPDGKADTRDDVQYEKMAQVRSLLGMSEEDFAPLEKTLTLKSDYRRIESTGRVSFYERKLTVVVQLNVTPVQYLTWIEF